jgi:hypothetical protein
MYGSDDIITGVASYICLGSRNLGYKLGKGYALMKEVSKCTYNVRMARFRAKIVVGEKEIISSYAETKFFVLGIKHAIHMRHIFICGLVGSTKFLDFCSQTARFSKKIYLTQIFFSISFFILRRI